MSEQPDVAERARQLHRQGLSIRDIADLLRTHEAQIARWLAVDHDEARAIHERAWSNER